jgi:alpha-beta hydrolase superfamily lysophospholipase
VAKIRLAPALSAEAAERVAPDYLLVYVGHSGGGGIALAIAVS